MAMTRNEFWTALDAVCASPDRSQSLLQVSDLLRDAYTADLPLLIACTRTPGKIHHSYTCFDPSKPDLAGNRYLICFTNPAQSRPSTPSVKEEETPLSLEERFKRIDEESNTAPAEEEKSLTLEERFRLIDEGADEFPSKKPHRARRKKSKETSPLWSTSTSSETATVRARDVLDYMKRSRAVGGLIFNVYDEKHSIALPKFMIG